MESQEQEIWKPIPLESLERFRASNLGRIASVREDGTLRIHEQSGVHVRNGRRVMHLTGTDGKPRTLYLRRLIAEAFLGPLPDGCGVVHLNDDENNCRADNLAHMTRSEVVRRGYASGRRRSGPSSWPPGTRKLDDAQVERVLAWRAEGLSNKQIALRLGGVITFSGVSRVVKRELFRRSSVPAA